MQESYKYALLIAYDGTSYGGWQVQDNAPSIQATLQLTLHTLLQTTVSLSGSGRTDAGVHALGQVAHFSSPLQLNIPKTFASLNKLLPPTIRVLNLVKVPPEFHARYSARAKTYHYHLHLNAIADPFKRLYCYKPHHPVPLDLLRRGASLFVGTHDFTSFSHQAHQGSAAHDPVRTISRITIIEEAGGVRLEFEGDGFLYKMVRNIVGTLLDVCAKKLSVEEIPSILGAKDRRLAGRTAPPEGLFLVQVHYDSNPFPQQGEPRDLFGS